ncbi:MAG: glycosyltransferase family 4 protein [Bacteroidetes bacterium]|nr:glycosyltransferase family 4 protein [Bacteroidota bacterium]HET6244974.1 glycosyltransferase family 4 protein [Bacteroidia bacterium]
MSSAKYIYIVQVTRQLSIDIVNNFSRQGADVHLITGVVESNYDALDQKVKLTSLIKYNSTSSFKRLFTWSVFTVYSFFYVLFSSRKNELILVTTPPFIVFIGLFFKKIRNQKYHLVIWDLYPDVLVNFGVSKESSLLIRIWKNMNIKCFNNAETIFTLGQHIADAIQKYTKKEIVIIPNWVKSDFLKPIPKKDNPFAIEHKLTEKLVIMYSGNLGLTHNIESIIDSAEILKNNANIHFVIIGDGVKKVKISQIVKEKKLENVLLLPYQEKEVLPFSLGCADIGVVTLSQGAENISVPSKTYYMLAAGSAILALASADSELGTLIAMHKCGEIFNGNNPQAIANFVLHLSLNKDDLIRFKDNSRKASFNYTPENAKLYYKYICNKINLKHV